MSILSLIKTRPTFCNGYAIITAEPATGVLYVTDRSPNFISGHLRMKGKNEGRYPHQYLDMIDKLFGYEQSTIEVCSRSVEGCYCVDINPETNPSIVTDGQTLEGIADNEFSRWRCDPPYNATTSKEMYNCELPSTSKLLQAGARVVKPGSLMFLLLGPQNFQWCPPSLRRIGWAAITIIPNQELRALHIYQKENNKQEHITSF